MTAYNTPCAVADRSIASATGSAQQAIGYNAYRTFLMIQANATHATTFSFTNSSVAAGGTGCFTLAAGAILVLSPAPANPLYVIGTTADFIAIAEG